MKQKWSVTIPGDTYEIWAETEEDAIDLAFDEHRYYSDVYAENLTESEKKYSLPEPSMPDEYYLERLGADNLLRYGEYDGKIYATDGYRVYSIDEYNGEFEEGLGEKLHGIMNSSDFGTMHTNLLPEKYRINTNEVIECVKQGKNHMIFIQERQRIITLTKLTLVGSWKRFIIRARTRL